MNEKQKQNQINEDIIDFRELLLLLSKGKWIVLLTTTIFSCVTILYVAQAAPQYDASTKIIYESTSGNSISHELGALAALAGVGPDDNNIENYISDIMYTADFIKPILVKKWQINEDDSVNMTLIEYWKLEADPLKLHADRILMQSAVLSMQEKILYSIGNKGIVTLTTSFQTPYLAYKINNYVVEKLNETILNSVKKKAGENKRYVKEQLTKARTELHSAENKLKAFKEKNAITMSPSLILEEQRLIREVEVENQVYLTLRKQYEMAKIEEQKDTPAITIIEKAQIPYKKSKPQKKKIVVMGGFAGIFVGIFLVFVLDWYKKNRETVKEILFAK